MKIMFLPFIILGLGTAAQAADYPPCSKTVQDECISAVPAHHAARMHKARYEHHAALHHGAKGKMEKSARS